MDPEACFRAVAARDRSQDGRFFTGVVTTGIYCRPVCPSRTPLRRNVVFFARRDDAVAAGFRACRRCRPEAAPGTPAWRGTAATVQRALRLIRDGAGDDVEALAAKLAVSARHLRRLFDVHVGASPQQVAAARRLARAHALLVETTLPMADVAAGAGYGSLRAFNREVRAAFGVTPSRVRGENDLSNVESSQRARRPARHDDASNTIKLTARPPLLWPELLSFFAPRAIPGVEAVVDDAYVRAVPGGRATIRAAGDGVVVTVTGGVDVAAVVARVRRMLDLDVDPRAVARFLGRDPRLARAVRGGVRLPCAYDPWEACVRAVVGQQISVKGAVTITGRIAARCGAPVVVGGAVTRAFPAAADLVDADLDGLGLPTARARTIRALAAAVVAGDVRFDAAVDDVVAALLRVPGVGPWTARYVAMRGLGDRDAFPSSDLGVLKALADDDGALPTPAQAEAIAEAWRPYRAYAAIALWRHPDGKAAAKRRRTR